MRKTTVYLPDDLDGALKARARRSGVPAAEYLRQVLRKALDEDEPPMPRSIGVGSGGTFDARDDEVVLARRWGGGRRSCR
jgi:plasmid stability protein